MTLTIINVGYRSTNYWVLSAGTSRLLVDLGWPGTMGAMRAGLTRMGVPLAELRAGFATHYDPDHAGLARELSEAGMKLLVFETQKSPVPGVPVKFAESRAVLADLGIAGEVAPTPGHSNDSVSLVLDSGETFTGDLTPMFVAPDDHRDVLERSWRRLRELGGRIIYPGHGPIRPMSA